jgi:hypothetical protein
MLKSEYLSWEGEVRTVILYRGETLHCCSVAKEWLDCPWSRVCVGGKGSVTLILSEDNRGAAKCDGRKLQ